MDLLNPPATGRWAYQMPFCSQKMTTNCSRKASNKIQTMAAKLASTGLTHARMDGHTDNYGEDSYNEVLSLKRANVVADAWAMGGQIPRSNLITQGLGKKYPIASNKTAQGRAENRRVAVVITTP